MTCHDVREQFSALVDDALGDDERRMLDAHLATCADCGRELQQFRETVALLRSVEPARAPAGFVDRVLGAARPVPWPRRVLRALLLPWPIKLPVEAAAVVLVAVGVVYLFRATPGIEQATRLRSNYQTDGIRSQTDTTSQTSATSSPTDTTQSRDVASAPSQVGAPVETIGTPKRDQGPEKPAAEEKPAAGKKLEAVPPAAPPGAKLKDAYRDVDRLASESRPAPPAEPPAAAGKIDAPPARAERERSAAKESARLPATAATPESRGDAAQARRSTTASPALTSLAPPDVSGRLAVADRDTALIGLAQLVTRLGGLQERRVDSTEGPIVEVRIPREAYAEFVRELSRLGLWQPTREGATLPAQVRVVLRITG